MHPFVVPFAILALIDIGIVLVAAWIRTAVCQDKPLATHALGVWALIVLLANLGNELRLSSLGVTTFVVLAAAVLIAVLAPPRSLRQLVSGIKQQLNEVALVLMVLALQMMVCLVPLVTVLPSRTLVAGKFVSDDPMAYAVLMRGFGVVHGLFGRVQYLSLYPDAFHAVVFGVSRFFPNADAPFFLLPTTVWASSFLGLAMLMWVRTEHVASRTAAVIIATSPAAAFLLGTALYLLYVSQVASLPFIVGGMVVASSWSVEDLRGRAVALPALLIVAALATYGLFAGTLIGLTAVIRLLASIRGRKDIETTARAWVRLMATPTVLVTLAVVAVLATPVIVKIYRGVPFFADQRQEIGNLPGGAVSPFHVTGFWKPGAEYRSQLSGADSYASTVLCAILAVQLWLVARARLTGATIAMLIAPAILVTASALGAGPYVHFKYLGVLTSVWVPAVFLGLLRLLERPAAPPRPWASLVMAGVLALMVGTPLPSFRALAVLPEHWFRTLDEIRARYLSQGPVLVLSGESWFQYYRDADDSLPMTMYWKSPYAGQAMRWVLVDDGYRDEAVAVLGRHVPDVQARLAACPADHIGGRFEVYEYACLVAARDETKPR